MRVSELCDSAVGFECLNPLPWLSTALQCYTHSATASLSRQRAWQSLENLTQLKADIIPCFSSGAGQLLPIRGYDWTLLLKKTYLTLFSICLGLSRCSRCARYLVDTSRFVCFLYFEGIQHIHICTWFIATSDL